MTEAKAFVIGFVGGAVLVLALLGSLWVAMHWATGLDWWPALVASIIVSGAFQQAQAKDPPAAALDMRAANLGGLSAHALFVFGCRVILAVAACSVLRGGQ